MCCRSEHKIISILTCFLPVSVMRMLAVFFLLLLQAAWLKRDLWAFNLGPLRDSYLWQMQMRTGFCILEVGVFLATSLVNEVGNNWGCTSMPQCHAPCPGLTTSFLLDVAVLWKMDVCRRGAGERSDCFVITAGDFSSLPSSFTFLERARLGILVISRCWSSVTWDEYTIFKVSCWIYGASLPPEAYVHYPLALTVPYIQILLS